jgi:hypothetical protein
MLWEYNLLMTIENLQDYKEKRKIKKIVTDLEKISRILSLTTKSITPYNHYAPVKNVLSVTYDNQQLIGIFLKKYKNLLKEKEIS